MIRWISIFLVVFTLPLLAEIYKIPQPLMEEGRQLRQIALEHPASANARFQLAMNYAYTGRIERGWGHLKKVPESFADTVIARYSEAIKEEPNNWKHPFKLAFGYYFKDQKQQAIESFKQVLAIQPNQVWAMGFIALVYGDLGETDKAIEWCQKGLSIQPNAAAIHFLLAEAYRRKGNYWSGMKHAMIVGRLKTEEAAYYRNEPKDDF